MSGECDKCGDHAFDCKCPTILTTADIDSFFEKCKSGQFDIKKKPCFKCGNEYFPNYGGSIGECDECYFARWPEEERKSFYRSFFE